MPPPPLADPLAELRAELGGDLPAGIERLENEAAEQLLVAIREAKTNQRTELHRAIEEGLEAVPRLIRGPMRKILFGGAQ